MKKLKFIMGMALSGLLLVGCSNGSDANSESGANGNETTVNIADFAELTGGDITQITDTKTFTMINNVQEGLYRFDENNELQPALVDGEPQVSDDKLTYTFTLREGAKWSNGEPVTAHDFEYGWKRMVNPDTGAGGAYFFDNVIKNAHKITYEKSDINTLGVKALDDYTLEVQLEKPIPYFLDLLADPLYFPHNEKAIKAFGDTYGSSSDTMVYNGPFTLENWNGGSTEWTYKKNPDYWDNEHVNVDNVNVQVIKEDATGANLYDSGEIDWAQLRGEYAKQYANHEDYVQVPQKNAMYLTLNQDKDKDLANKNLRLALAYAIDRKTLTDTVLGDGSTALSTLTPPDFAKTPDGSEYTDKLTNKQSNDNAQATAYLEKAKAELGKDNIILEYLSVDDESSKLVAEYIQGQIQDTLSGVSIEIRTVPSKSLYSTIESGDFDIARTGWGPDFADPITFLDMFVSSSSYNYGKYNNPAYDTLISNVKTTDADNLDQRMTDLAQAEDTLLGDAGIITAYSSGLTTLQRPTIKNLFIDPLTGQQTYKYMTIEN